MALAGTGPSLPAPLPHAGEGWPTPARRGGQAGVRAGSAGWVQVVAPLVTATLAAAGAELILLRLISRVGVHIPAASWARGAYAVAVAFGNLVFPAATVLATGTLVVMGLALLRRWPAAGVIALALPAGQLWLLAHGTSAEAVALLEALLAATLLIVPLLATGAPRGVRLFLGLTAAGEALGLAQTAVANLTVHGVPQLPLALATAGEVVMLLTLLLLPVLVPPRGWDRAALAAGFGAALLVALALAANGSTTRILALWTFGIAMVAPSPLYGLAAGALAATMVAHARGGRSAVAAGLALIALGGYLPGNSYQAALLLGGVLLFAFPWLLGHPAPCAGGPARPDRDATALRPGA
jgi:hypothetical protein